jgi:enoyl-CoA hydratase
VLFKRRAEAVGWKEAVRERDLGTYDWTADRKMSPE